MSTKSHSKESPKTRGGPGETLETSFLGLLTPYYSEQNIDLVKGARALSLSFLGASLSNKKIPFNRD